MSDPVDNWPSYHLGTKAHLHAIGVLVSAWNEIETCYQCFIQIILTRHRAASAHVFDLFGNDQRMKFIKAQLLPSLSDAERKHVEYFLKCSSICKENRNAVAHAHHGDFPVDDKLQMFKGLKPDRSDLDYFMMSVGDLREMADATFETHKYGMSIWATISLRITRDAYPDDPRWADAHAALPHKLALPRRWDQIREVPTPDQSQPPA